MILSEPSYFYTHPPRQGLLYFYEIFVGDKKLAKRVRKAFKADSNSIGKPLGIIDFIRRLRYKIGEKIRRKLGLGGPFGIGKVYENLYCLSVLSEEGYVERKLTRLISKL